jgi:hypothetical protein
MEIIVPIILFGIASTALYVKRDYFFPPPSAELRHAQIEDLSQREFDRAMNDLKAAYCKELLEWEDIFKAATGKNVTYGSDGKLRSYVQEPPKPPPSKTLISDAMARHMVYGPFGQMQPNLSAIMGQMQQSMQSQLAMAQQMQLRNSAFQPAGMPNGSTETWVTVEYNGKLVEMPLRKYEELRELAARQHTKDGDAWAQ